MKSLLKTVENIYGLKIKKCKILKNEKNSSFVAQLVTDKGHKYALKSLYQKKKRQNFIAQVEQALYRKGVPLARPVPSKDDRLYFTLEGTPYVLYEWIDAPTHRLDQYKDLKSLVRTVARFHRSSRGLTFPKGTRIYPHTPWEKEYEQRLKNLRTWQEKHKQASSAKKLLILRAIPFLHKLGTKALKRLKQSDYRTLANLTYTKQTLVHGDFHNRNVICDKNKNVIIDFEDVRYDLPSKDLIRLFSIYTKKRKFKKEEFKAMMKIYNQQHPLTHALQHVVMFDFLFPHIFERMVRKKKYKKMTYKQLKHFIEQDKNKARFIDKHYF